MGLNQQEWKNLAIFGAEPAFANPLYVGRPNIGNKKRLFARIEDMLSRRWLSNGGPFVIELEQKIEKLLGAQHCIATCNGTMALQIAARVLGLKGEVIVPSFTFVATAHALEWIGLTPVFCDVDRLTHQINPDEVVRALSPRTSGIIGVHLWGRACDVESLEQIARRNNLELMFDAAHAFNCSHTGQMIGNFGKLEVLSFHATKFFNTFEGGAIVTNDAIIAEKARLMRDFGFLATDKVVSAGTNGKMTEVAAAMGLTGFENLKDIVETNRQNYKEYQSALTNLPGISILSYDEVEQNNFHYIILEIEESVFGMSRDHLLQILNAEKVMARRYFYPGCHRSEPYRSSFKYSGLRMPVTELLSEQVLTLPNGTALAHGDVKKICEIIKMISKYSQQIRQAIIGTEDLVPGV